MYTIQFRFILPKIKKWKKNDEKHKHTEWKTTGGKEKEQIMYARPVKRIPRE